MCGFDDICDDEFTDDRTLWDWLLLFCYSFRTCHTWALCEERDDEDQYDHHCHRHLILLGRLNLGDLRDGIGCCGRASGFALCASGLLLITLVCNKPKVRSVWLCLRPFVVCYISYVWGYSGGGKVKKILEESLLCVGEKGKIDLVLAFYLPAYTELG